MKNLTLTAAKIAEIVKGQVVGDPERTITGVSGIREAKNTDLSFVGNKRYEKQLSETNRLRRPCQCRNRKPHTHRLRKR